MQKPVSRKESLLIKWLGGALISLPLALAEAVLVLYPRITRPWVKKSVVGGFVLLWLGILFGFGLIFDLLALICQSLDASPLFEGGIRFILCYLFYIVAALPVFLPAAHFRQTAKLFKPDREKKDPAPGLMRGFRLKSSAQSVYLGQSFDTGEPVYLSNDQRQMHCEVVGSTGTGKTESVLLPLLAHDLTHGKGAVIIDGKGDLELLNRIHYIVQKKNRTQDFFFFSLSHPGKSNTYNPLFEGNPTELKDKLINSMSWSEEFYRRMAEQAVLTLFSALAARPRKKRARFRDLHSYLTEFEALKRLGDETRDPVLKEDIGKMLGNFRDNQKFLPGLTADLYLNSRSEFSDLLDVKMPEIDLFEVYQKKKICYFALDLQKYADTSRRLGRMIVQDLRAVSSRIQAEIPSGTRHFFPVFIDDASSFLDVNFIDFLSKCRASGFAVTILHQSLGDLVFRGMSNFQQQVMENTNIKIVLRQDDPWSVEKFSKIGGTRRTIIPTYQTEEKMAGKGFTGAGSVREGQTFRVEPDLIRGLKRGEAAVIWKTPSLLTAHVKLDFFGHTRYPGIFKPIHPPPGKDEEQEPKPQLVMDENGRIVKPHEEVLLTENPLEIIEEVGRLKKNKS